MPNLDVEQAEIEVSLVVSNQDSTVASATDAPTLPDIAKQYPHLNELLRKDEVIVCVAPEKKETVPIPVFGLCVFMPLVVVAIALCLSGEPRLSAGMTLVSILWMPFIAYAFCYCTLLEPNKEVSLVITNQRVFRASGSHLIRSSCLEREYIGDVNYEDSTISIRPSKQIFSGICSTLASAASLNAVLTVLRDSSKTAAGFSAPEGCSQEMIRTLRRFIRADENVLLSTRLAPLQEETLSQVELRRQREYASFQLMIAYFYCFAGALGTGIAMFLMQPFLPSLLTAFAAITIAFYIAVKVGTRMVGSNQTRVKGDCDQEQLLVITNSRIIHCLWSGSQVSLERNSIGSIYASHSSGRFLMTISPNTHTRTPDMQLEFKTAEDMAAAEALLRKDGGATPALVRESNWESEDLENDRKTGDQ